MCLLWGIRQQGELPFIGKEQKQSAATAGSCIPGSAFHSSYHCHFTQNNQQKQTSRDISCIFTQTNKSPEALKASHVWTIKHTRACFFFVHFLQRSAETQETRSPGKRRDTQLFTHHSLHQNPFSQSVHVRWEFSWALSYYCFFVYWLPLLINSLFSDRFRVRFWCVITCFLCLCTFN